MWVCGIYNVVIQWFVVLGYYVIRQAAFAMNIEHFIALWSLIYFEWHKYWLFISYINCIAARCLINVVYLKAFAFIRLWWCCTFLNDIANELNQHKNWKLRHNCWDWNNGYWLIEFQVGIFWYQVYQAQLWEGMLNCLASLAMSTRVPRALPGKLDLKRHSLSIDYI